MPAIDAKSHWESVYRARVPDTLTWFEEHARLSLEFIERTGASKSARIIDVGGGGSTLVDDLLEQGYGNVTVLDISSTALNLSRIRLGARADSVTWIEADITRAALPAAHYDVWHDRAVFHFLTDRETRRRYVQAVKRSVKPGGHVIVATFAPDGPAQCSGLDVARYDPESLLTEFGEGFRLMESVRATHHTPAGAEQKFIYCCFRRE